MALAKFIIHTGVLQAFLTAAMDAPVNRAAQMVADEARSLAPKLTGAGADGINARPAGKARAQVKWSDATPYMLYQEFGTVHHRAQPHMRPAAMKKYTL
ncbi:MAG: hypothetical protein L0Y56_05160 [Nitrospira sp.]|nr:hypothetical protein [Nitrospira sp.]